MKEWMKNNFGKTLCDLFFHSFHELYTAGLYSLIAPQDSYKTMPCVSLTPQACRKKVAQGYNEFFLYPHKGLDHLVYALEKRCDVTYNKRLIRIDTIRKKLYFSDSSSLSYNKIISTIPLNTMVALTETPVRSKPDPYSSLLVLNIGATRGKKCRVSLGLFFKH